VVAEPVPCAECGEPIGSPESAVTMVRDDAAVAAEPRLSRLVFHFHLNCAPQELVGQWVRVYDD
jgi:hypothetical protein